MKLASSLDANGLRLRNLPDPGAGGDAAPWRAVPRLVMHEVNTASATVALQPGTNLIRVNFNGEVAITVTSTADCLYEVVRESGSGTVTVTQG